MSKYAAYKLCDTNKVFLMKFAASFSGNRGDIVQCLKQSLHSQDAWQFSSGKPNLQAPANEAQMPERMMLRISLISRFLCITITIIALERKC